MTTQPVAKIVSPIDNSVVAERPIATDAQIRVAVAEAKISQAKWRNTSIADRAAICQRAVSEMNSMADEIVPELARQMGRPIRYGRGELRGFTERSEHMISIAAEALAPTEVAPRVGFTRYIEHVPLGVVLVVAPWNYPFLTAVNSIIPALMAGNAVILKHATQTLLVGERFQKAFDQAGLPAGLFSNMVLSHEAIAALLAAGEIDQVNFTGSVQGGRDIEQACAGTFTGVGLELGGKDPAYVRADANIAHAVENIVDGAFFNSGQSCCGIERVYVARAVYDEFVKGCIEVTNGYVLGDPLDEATTLGPMVRGSAADAVRKQILAAIAGGARQVVDLTRFPKDEQGSAYLAPHILVDVDHSMAVMCEESFGPVVGIMAVDSDEQAIRLMNDSAYGLTASIWSADVEAVQSIGRELETGTVFMNRADYLDPALAWTGVKDTGKGVTLSTLGYGALTRPKSFHLRTQIA